MVGNLLKNLCMDDDPKTYKLFQNIRIITNSRRSELTKGKKIKIAKIPLQI